VTAPVAQCENGQHSNICSSSARSLVQRHLRARVRMTHHSPSGLNRPAFSPAEIIPGPAVRLEGRGDGLQNAHARLNNFPAASLSRQRAPIKCRAHFQLGLGTTAALRMRPQGRRRGGGGMDERCREHGGDTSCSSPVAHLAAPSSQPA
jgi:hypothetical protein